MYKITRDDTVIRLSDGCTIPKYPGNKDYEDYLEWNKINTPAPADPIPNPEIGLIDAQLKELDVKRIRPLAEGDTAYLQQLNQQVQALRTKRATLPLMI